MCRLPDSSDCCVAFNRCRVTWPEGQGPQEKQLSILLTHRQEIFTELLPSPAAAHTGQVWTVSFWNAARRIFNNCSRRLAIPEGHLRERKKCMCPVYILLPCSQGSLLDLGEQKASKWPMCVWGGAKRLQALWLEGGNTVCQVNENFARKTPRRPRGLTSITRSSGVLPSPQQLPFVTVAMASFGVGSGSPGEHSLLLQEQTWDFRKRRRDPKFLRFCFITASEQLNWFSFCFGLIFPDVLSRTECKWCLWPVLLSCVSSQFRNTELLSDWDGFTLANKTTKQKQDVCKRKWMFCCRSLNYCCLFKKKKKKASTFSWKVFRAFSTRDNPRPALKMNWPLYGLVDVEYLIWTNRHLCLFVWFFF